VYFIEMKKRYIIVIVKGHRTKARINRDGFMGSASREHRVKKGKGSFRRHSKHKEQL
jgi:stalled ribosome alternative rescue factor ArfA